MTQTAAMPAADEEPLDLAFVTSIRRHRTKVPTVLQLEATECGAASLAMVLAHHGRWVPLEEARAACAVSRDGASAKGIVTAARSYGLEATGVSVSLARLAEQPMPCIAYWDFAHFLVVEGADRHGVFVNDPAKGRGHLPWSDVDRSFTGLVLRMAPGPSFETGGRRRSVLASIRWRLTGMHAALAYLLVAGLALAIPVLLGPLALQAFVAQYLQGGLKAWAAISIALIAVSVVLGLWLTGWQAVVARRFTQAMNANEARTLVARALRLPTSFYAQRYPGEVAARLQLTEGVARIVTSAVLPSVLGLVTSIAVAVALVAFAWQIALIAVIAAIAAVLTVRGVQTARGDLAGRLSQEQSALAATVSYSLRSIETVKATGGEDAATQLALGHYARTVDARADLQRSSAMLGVLPSLVTGIAMALVVGLGGALVELGQLTTAAYIAVLALVPIFMRPVASWSAAIDALQQARTWLAKLDDLLDQPLAAEGDAVPAGGGRLELRGVSFAYGPTTPPAVEGLSLVVEPGRRVALVGASGSGKSTAARIAVGLLSPSSGEVRIDGVDVAACAPAARASAIGYVEQDVVLFAGTVRDNITLFDDGPTLEAVRQAARAAAIEADIEARPGGYDAPVADGGRNLSGGQRQRLEIARIMLARPGIVVLDEATSALDPLVEQSVMDALVDSGCGLLVIAHRLSTVRDCDEIIVMADGRVVERGDHQTLLDLNGAYASLVREAP